MAGAFASLMRWWVEADMRQNASHVAHLYETVARRILKASW